MAGVFENDKCKMKNILLFYPYPSQHNLIKNFSAYLYTEGICVDYICVGDYSYSIRSCARWPIITRMFLKIYSKTKSQFLHKCCGFLLSHFKGLIENIICLYTFVDFHVAAVSYLPYMRYCDKNGIAYDITLWGSDVMRAKDENIKKMQYGFEHCRYIKSSDNLRDALNYRVGNLYDAKFKVLYFGNSDFAKIDSLRSEQSSTIKESLIKADGQSLVIVCGYNASLAQNHLDIIKAIGDARMSFDRNVHLVFPLTYGGNDAYFQEIENKLKETGLPYTLLTHFLSSEELATLRKCSDVVINIQDTDALAGSLQDHLYCGNVCIFGDWLNYQIYVDNNVYYVKTSREGLSERIVSVINNFESYAQKCSANHEIIKELLSWDSVIHKWSCLYVE